MNAVAMRMLQALVAAAAFVAAAHAAEPSLTAHQWSILEMDGKRVRAPATVSFTRVRWLGVGTPCGSLWGWYRQSGTALKMHIAGRTRYQLGYGSPCRGIDYQLLLGRVRSFTLEGDRLVLWGDGGKAVARLARTQ